MKRLLFILCSVLMFTILSANVGEGVSSLFTLDTTNPVISVLNPNGGEQLLSNQEFIIRWTATDGHLTGNTITIKFTPNNGGYWQTLSSSESNDGNYLWTVPSAYTQAALIKIMATDDFGNSASDLSDNFFSIDYQSNYGVSSIFAMDTVDPTLDLTSPDGGEEWYIDDVHDILWSASDNHFSATPIIIKFSSSGNNYSTIAENEANDGVYSWQIPTIQTDEARIKIIVSDTFGNCVQDSSASVFTISYVPPKAPTNVTIDTSNVIDAVISWDAVTQTIYGTPFTPDGYIVLYNETPYTDSNYYYFLGATSNLTFTHLRVAEFRDQMFYKVVAYKDYSGKISRYLAKLNLLNAKNSLKWLESKSNHLSLKASFNHSKGNLTWLELKKNLKNKEIIK